MKQLNNKIYVCAQLSMTVWNIYTHCSTQSLGVGCPVTWRLPGSAGLHCALCPGRRPICTNQGLWFPGGSGQWGVSAGGEGRWERREEGRRERRLLPRLSPCRIAANQPPPQSNPRVLAAQRPVCCSLPSSFSPGEGVCVLCPLCDPVGCGPPRSSVLGILQAAILE